MKYLFFFAHPDDETVACGGTMKLLAENGHEVIVVSATDGAAGEVKAHLQQEVEKHGSVGLLRRHEMSQVAQLLGVHHCTILDFEDGQITNEMVWGKLTSTFIDVIDHHKPDVVVTFDHSGWYFHLDHVGVSIAATLAVQKAAHQPDLFFHSHFRVDNTKWKYVYSKTMPVTHQVDVTKYKELKLQAFDLHQSQNLKEPRQQVEKQEKHFELYQLVFATEKGRQLLENHELFVTVTS